MIEIEPNGVIAVFSTEADADGGLEALSAQGFDMETVSVLGPGHPHAMTPELDTSAEHNAEVARHWGRWGAIVGATVGGGIIAIPLMVALVGLGPFAPVLAAIAVGATGIGSLASALVGLGVHEKHAHEYAEALNAGKTLVVAHTDVLADLETARDALATKAERVTTHGLKSLGA
ncbi:MAG: hypothetical protein ACI9KE_000658 [Polyangiales bacterium]|jgi:hypothetical protein